MVGERAFSSCDDISFELYWDQSSVESRPRPFYKHVVVGSFLFDRLTKFHYALFSESGFDTAVKP